MRPFDRAMYAMFLLVLLADVARGQSPTLLAADGAQTLTSATRAGLLPTRQSSGFSLESRALSGQTDIAGTRIRSLAAEADRDHARDSARDLARERAKNRTRELLSSYRSAARSAAASSAVRSLFGAPDLSYLLAPELSIPVSFDLASTRVEPALDIASHSTGIFAHTASPAP